MENIVSKVNHSKTSSNLKYLIMVTVIAYLSFSGYHLWTFRSLSLDSEYHDNLKANIANLTVKYDKIHSDVLEISKEKNLLESIRQDYRKLNDQKNKLEFEVDNLKRLIESEKDINLRIQNLNKQNSDLTIANSNYNNENKRLKLEIDRLNPLVKSLTVKLDQLKEDEATLKEKNIQLSQISENIDQNNNNLKELKLLISKNDLVLESKRNEIEKREQQLAKMDFDETIIFNKKEILAKLETKESLLKESSEKAENELKIVNKQLNIKQNDLNSIKKLIEQKEIDLDKIVRELKDNKISKDAIENEILLKKNEFSNCDTSLRDIKQKVKSLNNDYNDLLTTLEINKEHAKNIDEKKRTSLLLDKEIEEKNNKSKQLSFEIKNLETTRNIIEAYNKENARAEQKLQNLQKLIKDSYKEYGQIQTIEKTNTNFDTPNVGEI